MSTLYAKSTIAMSAYNFIAMSRRKLELEEIYRGISTQHPEVEEVDVEEGLMTLLLKKWITFDDQGYDLIDIERRIVVQRDCSDVGYDKNGEPTGCWNGWLVREIDGSLRSIAEVVK